MMSLEERADLIYNNINGNSNRDYAIGYAERHLREACEEAVRAAQENTRQGRLMAKDPWPEKCVCKQMSQDVIAFDPRCPVHGAPSSRPTPEDALKAVNDIARLMHGGTPEDWDILSTGITDLLAGHRDTPAAKAIIGEEGK
jgi:hypothetical protein